MKKFLLSALILLSTSSLFAQYKREFGGSLGFTNYLGDIGGGIKERRDFVADLRWQQTRYTINGYFRLKLNKDFSYRSSLIYARLNGDDKNSTNPARVGRNLSFKTDILELMNTAEWNFYQQTKMSPRTSLVSKGGKKRLDFRAYLFTGVGLLYFNPRAELNGKMYNLRPLQTEGTSYSAFTWTVPVGFGFAYTLNKTIRIGMDFSYRFTGSDYLDDVSGNYKVGYKQSADNPADPKFALANRTPEIQSYQVKGSNYNSNLPTGDNYDYNTTTNTGTKRGYSSERDGYFLVNVTAGYVIKGKNKYYKSKYRNIVNRRKVVKKKTRAKF